jgi:glycolate oxidase iron-sulfur subunit
VPYGRLQEGVRETLAAQHRITPRWQRVAFAVLPRHKVLLAGSTLVAVAQRVRLVPARLGIPRLPLRRPAALAPTGGDVWLFTGCVMDAWQRDTHASTAKVLGAIGVTYALPAKGGDCCGALHTHAGLTESSRRLAARVMSSMPGHAPIIVNSAGCGAALKDYGHLLGTPAAAEFGRRVRDVHEFVAQHLDRLGPRRHLGRVVVHDPCHLRHVQRTQQVVRTVLATIADLIELDDDGLCCGAGGAYSATQPELAGKMRDSKIAAIERVGGGVVASANPGCSIYLAAAGALVRHPMDLLAEAL